VALATAIKVTATSSDLIMVQLRIRSLTLLNIEGFCNPLMWIIGPVSSHLDALPQRSSCKGKARKAKCAHPRPSGAECSSPDPGIEIALPEVPVSLCRRPGVHPADDRGALGRRQFCSCGAAGLSLESNFLRDLRAVEARSL